MWTTTRPIQYSITKNAEQDNLTTRNERSDSEISPKHLPNPTNHQKQQPKSAGHIGIVITNKKEYITPFV
jgi:hypothetical protein